MEESHFASKNQLPGLSVTGTLVKNRLKEHVDFLKIVLMGDLYTFEM